MREACIETVARKESYAVEFVKLSIFDTFSPWLTRDQIAAGVSS